MNGGAHAANNVDFQEFMVVPIGFETYHEALRAVAEIYQGLKKLLAESGALRAASGTREVSPLTWRATARRSGSSPRPSRGAVTLWGTRSPSPSTPRPPSSTRTADTTWPARARSSPGRRWSSTTSGCATEYPIISIEDGLAEDDWEGWAMITERLGDRVQLVGDDLFVTNPKILGRGIEEGVGNSILIKVNQIGTLTETFETMELAHKSGYTTMISHRSGETEDATISDLAVAVNAGQIKTGAPARGERVAKYNQLLRIEEVLGEVGLLPWPRRVQPEGRAGKRGLKMRRTKIVATLGPATSTEEAIGSLIQAGVDVTRFNFSHGEHSMHLKNAEIVRRVAGETGRNVAILQDVQGPKIRTGEVEEGTELVEGSRVVLAAGDFSGDASRLSTSYENLADDVRPGHRLLIDDGLIGLRVESIENGEVVCEVLEGGPVSSHKGLNFPDSTLSIRGLTPKDVEDLRFGMEELHPDWVAMSFVRTADEVREVKERIKEFGGNAPVISKIEKHEAIDNIEDIIAASDGIMVARGDLAVELSAERVPIEQKRMIARCRRLGKPIIVATQMLDSMIRNPRPTRAEVSDVANAIFDRADAVMLSGETAVGRYP